MKRRDFMVMVKGLRDIVECDHIWMVKKITKRWVNAKCSECGAVRYRLKQTSEEWE